VITVGADGSKSVDVEGAAPPTPGLLGSIQRSKVWTALTYGMNYDIHKVSCVCCARVRMLDLIQNTCVLTPEGVGSDSVHGRAIGTCLLAR
jgi:hypothetical protein